MTTQTWSTTQKNASLVLSSGNLVCTFGGTTSTDRSVYALFGVTTGKFYWEEVPTQANSNPCYGIGITTSDVTDGAWVGRDANSLGWDGSGAVWNANGTVATWATYASGNTLSFALDLVNNKFWGRVGAGNWNNSGTANPATNVGGVTIPAAILAGTVVPGASLFSTSQVATAKFTRASWLQTEPSGFIAFDEIGTPLNISARGAAMARGQVAATQSTALPISVRGAARARGQAAATQSTGGGGGGGDLTSGVSPPFFVVELDVFKPGDSFVTIAWGWGTSPRGTLAQFPDAISDSTTILASDVGYRSLPTDSGGVKVYPPLLGEAFAVDRRMNLDPAQPGVAAAWGTVQLSNATDNFDAIAGSWNSDGRNVKVYYGTKTYDATRGIFVDPSNTTLTLAFTGVATPWFLTESLLNVPIRDATYWIERLLQTTLYAGTGGLEGPATLTNVPKPKARGGTAGNPIKNVTPTLVDPTNRIYQYNDAAGTVVTLYEGANVYTPDPAGDTTSLIGAAVAAGQYRTDNSRGLFKLGSTPLQTITADVTGAFPAAGAISNPVSIVRYMLAEDMVLPSANMDVSSFTAGATAFPYTAGVYFGSDEVLDGATALARVLVGFGGSLIPTRTGLLRFVGLRALPITASPVVTFSPANVVTLIPQNLPSTLDPPPFRYRVGYNHNYTIQTTFLLAATLAQQQFVQKADSYSSSSSSTVLTAYRRPNDPQPLVGCLLSSADAQTVADALGVLWFTRRRLYAATVPLSVGLVREFGDVVNVVWPMDDLASGKLGQIVGEQFRTQDATVTLLVLV